MYLAVISELGERRHVIAMGFISKRHFSYPHCEQRKKGIKRTLELIKGHSRVEQGTNEGARFTQ